MLCSGAGLCNVALGSCQCDEDSRGPDCSILSMKSAQDASQQIGLLSTIPHSAPHISFYRSSAYNRPALVLAAMLPFMAILVMAFRQRLRRSLASSGPGSRSTTSTSANGNPHAGLKYL